MGKNLPISEDHVPAGIGEDKIRQIAEKAVISSEAESLRLAELLTSLID